MLITTIIFKKLWPAEDFFKIIDPRAIFFKLPATYKRLPTPGLETSSN